MNESLKFIPRQARRFLGTDSLVFKLETQQQQLLQVISLLRHSVVDSERTRASETYRRCAEIVSLLTPMDIEGGKYVRVGRNNDGGYVMLDNFDGASVEAAYSFGISTDASWDEAIAARGIDVYMFDHTIESPPSNHPRFHFFRSGVTGYRSSIDLDTLTNFVRKNSHATSKNLLLKMDVEACEWDVLQETPSEVLDQFSQIVIELHELCPIRGDTHHRAVVESLRKINRTHQSIHVHANINCTPLWIEDKILPDLMEVTYIRRSDVSNVLVENRRTFPTRLDQPTFEGFPDLDLGNFR